MNPTGTHNNSFIFDRNWERVNPARENNVSLEQAKLFLKLVLQEHLRLKRIGEQGGEELSELKAEERVELFLFKYVQEKEIAQTLKKELPALQKAPYRFDLNDCLEIWRWISEDSLSFKTRGSLDEALTANEFELGQGYETFEIKKSVDYGSANKRIFPELSLEEQQSVLKKSLEMVHLYSHQFRIIFNHYCKFTIQNEHKRTLTFDDMAPSLERMTVNRFMLFCREFDVIKTLEFKRRTERNPTMSKQFLLKVFKKGSVLQRFMDFGQFTMALVHIAIKIHENFDPRSYMHVELFLNSLKVKYYEEFVRKLDSLQIKYSPTEFYNCYKHIFNKLAIRKKKESKSTLFSNPHFAPHDNASSRMESVEMTPKQPEAAQNGIRSYLSVPNLAVEYRSKPSKTLQKRKVSVPLLPSLEENKYFKPIEPNHSRSVYNKYLEKVQYSTSVFKSRITGYSNINQLKTKGFHMNNPQAISKQDFESMMTSKKTNIREGNASVMQGSLVQENGSKLAPVPQRTSLTEKTGRIDPKTHTMNAHQFLQREENKKVLEGLKQKIDVKDNDELLSKHLKAQEKQRQASTISQSK